MKKYRTLFDDHLTHFLLLTMVKADEKPMEVTIDGRVYDVSSLDGRHPGGGVFKFYLGEDATIAFNEFHGRSPRAFKWLKTLKSKPVAEELSPLEQDFRKFRQELVDEGWFEPSYPHLIYRCLELILMHYIGFKLMVRNERCTPRPPSCFCLASASL